MSDYYLIGNITDKEIQALENSDFDWWITDSLESREVCIYGTRTSVEKALQIIGRKIEIISEC